MVQDNSEFDFLHNSTKVKKSDFGHGSVKNADPILFLWWEGVRMEMQILVSDKKKKKKVN